MSRTLLVAPREVHDLVLRCARVAGCSAGVADRLARNVTAAEVDLGAAIEVFVDAMEGGNLPESPLASAPDVLAGAEVAARSGASATATFDPPAPLAGLSASIDETEGRGVVICGVHGAATAGTMVSELVLSVGTADPPTVGPGAAYRDGLRVAGEAFDRLVEEAKRFLVAEATLDAIET